MRLARILVLVVFMLGLASVGAEAQKKGNIGYVDLSRLFDEYYKTKDFDKVLEDRYKSFDEQRNSMIEKIRDAQGRLGLLKENEKGKLEGEIEQLKAELLEYDGQQKQDLTKERNDKIREILLEIEKVVSDYAKSKDYSVILNDRVLIYGSETFDLTETILGILNDKK